jgi:hypothetical protein
MNHPGAWKHRSKENCGFSEPLWNLVARTHTFDKACQLPLFNYHGQWDCFETSTVRIHQALFIDATHTKIFSFTCPNVVLWNLYVYYRQSFCAWMSVILSGATCYCNDYIINRQKCSWCFIKCIQNSMFLLVIPLCYGQCQHWSG